MIKKIIKAKFLLFVFLSLFASATVTEAVESTTSSVITLDYDDSNLKAAGVVPYTVADDGKVYVLLGRQTISTIPSSGLWKGFGGKRDPGETIIFTALREAKEESRAVLGENNPIYNPNQFPFDQVIVTEHTNFKYLQLMAPVAWDPEVPNRFKTIFSSNPWEMEKLEVRWIAFEELYKSIGEGYQASIDQKCTPSQINRIIHVKDGDDYLPLAKDFVETLSINYSNPHDSFHLLGKNIVPVPASLSSDKKN